LKTNQLREKSRESTAAARKVLDRIYRRAALPAWTPRGYLVNVAPYKHGVSYGNGWTHIDGWSERIVDYIGAAEAEAAA